MSRKKRVSDRAILLWFDREVKQEFQDGFIASLDEYGDDWQWDAKGRLRVGHGVLTGTFQRSIHYASPNYNFANDDVEPSPNSPERAGTGGGAEPVGSRIAWQAGSGLRYAVFPENMFGAMREAFAAQNSRLIKIMREHSPKRTKRRRF